MWQSNILKKLSDFGKVLHVQEHLKGDTTSQTAKTNMLSFFNQLGKFGAAPIAIRN